MIKAEELLKLSPIEPTQKEAQSVFRNLLIVFTQKRSGNTFASAK
jgi:hypothetical protein